MKAKDIMSKEVIFVRQDASIADIASTLVNHSISGVPVVDEDGSLVGIVTEGDLLRKEAGPRVPGYLSLLGGIIYYRGVSQFYEDMRKIMAEQAESIMTAKVLTVTEDTDIDQVASIMRDHAIKRLPVVRDGKLVGIISRRDIIKLLIG